MHSGWILLTVVDFKKDDKVPCTNCGLEGCDVTVTYAQVVEISQCPCCKSHTGLNTLLSSTRGKEEKVIK